MITEVVYGEVEDYVLTAQLPGLGTAGTLGLGSILVVVAWQSIQRRRQRRDHRLRYHRQSNQMMNRYPTRVPLCGDLRENSVPIFQRSAEPAPMAES